MKQLNENEKTIIRKMAMVIPKMSEHEKGYFLGYAECMANMAIEREKEGKEEEEVCQK